MDAKEYLRQVYRINELTKTYKQELEKLKELEAFEELCPELTEKREALRTIISDNIAKNLSIWAEVRNTINSVENENERSVLTMRYLENCQWEDIAKRMHYSESQIRRFYFGGLDKVNKMITKSQTMKGNDTK